MVTGAFSYTGGFIARELVSRGAKVKTLTNHYRPEHPLSGLVDSAPLDFSDPLSLTRAMRGTDLLFNTYWVRFPRGKISYELAIKNTEILLDVAKRVGVKKVIHISVTNPDQGSRLPYYGGKLKTEELVINSGLPFCIIRPSLIYGPKEILLHNIAWLLRNFPVFAIPGSGEYLLQPVSGEDVGRLAVDASEIKMNEIFDAVGPETISYNQLIGLMARALKRNPKIIHVNPKTAVFAGFLVGIFVGDVMITENEIKGLMTNLLKSKKPPLGGDSFSRWLENNAKQLGTEYTSEIKRHFTF